MFFVLIITAIFVVISIYFFLRAEKLQRQLISQKRDSFITRKENKVLADSMTLFSTRGQEFAQAKLARLKVQAKSSEDEQLIIHVELISPLINNYSVIFRECLRGKGRLKAVSQKCFENHDRAAYKKFVAYIVTGDKQLKRYWSSDNLNGFLFLVDALLTIEDSISASSNLKKTVCTS